MVSTKKLSEFDDGGDDRDITAVGLEGGVNKKWENTPIMAPSGNTASRPATPTIPSLRYNTDFGQLEYWDGANWFQIEDAGDIASLIARLAAHTVGDGASMIGLQNQGAVSNKTVQDLAEADFIVRDDTSSLVNAIALSALATGLLVVENGTGNLIPRSIAGTSSQITINNGTGLAGNPTVSIAANPEIPGNADIQIPSGTTAQRPGMSLGGMVRYNTTLHAFEFYDATDLVWKQPVSLSVAMTNGQLIIGSTGNNPVVSTLTAGAGITISNAPGSITISGGGDGIAKNLIIGGDFTTNPWQRGTSFPGALWVSGDYNADRFFATYSSTGVTTISRVADAPTVAQAGILATECLQIAVTTADATISASDFYLLGQRIEGYNFSRIAQRPFTLSFWVKFSKTGTYCVSFKNSGVDRSYVAEFSVDAANTWEKKIITVPASPSGGTWNYSSGIGLQILWMIACGTNLQTTPNSWQTGSFNATSNQVNGLDSNTNTFRIALIQCEPGEVATPFEIRSVNSELRLCQRYYQKTFQQGVTPAVNSGSLPGALFYRATVAGVAPGGVTWDFAEIMRATPSALFFNPQSAATTWRNLSTATNSGASAAGSNTSDSRMFVASTQLAGDAELNALIIHATVEAEL